MSRYVEGIEEKDDQARRARLIEMASQLLAPQPITAPQDLDLIQRTNAVSKRAIAETEYPSLGDSILQTSLSKRPSLNASQNAIALPALDRVMQAAADTPVISQRKGADSVFALHNNSERQRNLSATNQAARNDDQTVSLPVLSQVLQEAQNVLQDGQNNLRAGNLNAAEIAQELSKSGADIAQEAIVKAVDNLQASTGARLASFPNIARAVVELDLKVEAFKMGQLDRHKQESDRCSAKIKDFLKLSGKLDQLPSDRDSHNLKEEVLDKLQGPERESMEACLREIFPGESLTISREQLQGGKVRITDTMGEYKTQMTNILTTKISVIIQQLQMINQIVQDIIRKQHQLHTTVINHFGGR